MCYLLISFKVSFWRYGISQIILCALRALTRFWIHFLFSRLCCHRHKGLCFVFVFLWCGLAENEFKPLLVSQVKLIQMANSSCFLWKNNFSNVTGMGLQTVATLLQSLKPWNRTKIADSWSSVSVLSQWELLQMSCRLWNADDSRLWKKSCSWCTDPAQFTELCSLWVHLKGSDRFFHLY